MDESADRLGAALDSLGGELEKELRLLGELPQVHLTEKVVFDRAIPRGSVAQKRGAICKLLCCGIQLDQKCNDLNGEKACPTVIDAVRLLRLKVLEKHGSISCMEKVLREQEGSAASVPSTTKSNAFSALMEGQLAQQRAQSALRQAEALVSERRAQAQMAYFALEQVVANHVEPCRCM